jgi:hypothetical protein
VAARQPYRAGALLPYTATSKQARRGRRLNDGRSGADSRSPPLRSPAAQPAATACCSVLRGRWRMAGLHACITGAHCPAFIFDFFFWRKTHGPASTGNPLGPARSLSSLLLWIWAMARLHYAAIPGPRRTLPYVRAPLGVELDRHVGACRPFISDPPAMGVAKRVCRDTVATPCVYRCACTYERAPGPPSCIVSYANI